MANGQKRKRNIFSLPDGENTITGDEELLKHATSYYKTLFGPGEGNLFDLDPDLWTEAERVTEEENNELINLLMWRK